MCASRGPGSGFRHSPRNIFASSAVEFALEAAEHGQLAPARARSRDGLKLIMAPRLAGQSPNLDTERASRHRLGPDRALRDLGDAASFLEEMGLLVQTPHAYLPSLFGAAQGEPHKPGAAGFGQWPGHAWHWAGELAERADVLLTKVLLGRRTLVHQRLWKTLDSVVRQLEPLTKDAQAIIEALEKHRLSRTDELRTLAGFEGGAGKKRFDKAMAQLCWSGQVICKPALVGAHQHVAIAQLWSTRFPKPLGKPLGPGAFIAAAIEAAGRAPQHEVLKWWAWPRPMVEGALAALLASGEIRLKNGLLSRTAPLT